MKTIADTIVRSAPGFDAMPGFRDIREALRRPAANHVGTIGGYRPGVERFIFPASEVAAMEGLPAAFGEETNLWTIARVPVFPCWIEFGNWGWFIARSEAGRGVEFGTAVVFARGGEGGVAVPIGHMFLPAPGVSNPQADIGIFGHWPKTETATALESASFLAALLALICSPRVTSTRCIAPGLAHRPSAAYARKQAQRGRPVFSFNEVTLVPAKTALHRGELRPVESFAGMRGHMVIGHWRLIDGQLEPYWIWVDGHRRGDDSLGSIVKQRNVVDLKNRFRRGFIVPSETGRRGDRKPASTSP